MEAAYQLAVAHEMGFGVKHSPLAAFVLYKNLSRAGHVGAMYDYGRFLYQGLGPVLDEDAGMSMFKEAAYEGYVPAQVAYGFGLENGGNRYKDYYTPLWWYERAMSQGYPDGFYHTARVYREVSC